MPGQQRDPGPGAARRLPGRPAGLGVGLRLAPVPPRPPHLPRTAGSRSTAWPSAPTARGSPPSRARSSTTSRPGKGTWSSATWSLAERSSPIETSPAASGAWPSAPTAAGSPPATPRTWSSGMRPPARKVPLARSRQSRRPAPQPGIQPGQPADHRGIRGNSTGPRASATPSSGIRRAARLIERIPGDRGTVYSVAFSPDGREVALASDGLVEVCDVEAPTRPIRPLRGHTGFVYAVAFSPRRPVPRLGRPRPDPQALGSRNGRGGPGLLRARGLRPRPGVQPRRPMAPLGQRGQDPQVVGGRLRSPARHLPRPPEPRELRRLQPRSAGCSPRVGKTTRSSSGSRRRARSSPSRGTTGVNGVAFSPDGRRIVSGAGASLDAGPCDAVGRDDGRSARAFLRRLPCGLVRGAAPGTAGASPRPAGTGP